MDNAVDAEVNIEKLWPINRAQISVTLLKVSPRCRKFIYKVMGLAFIIGSRRLTGSFPAAGRATNSRKVLSDMPDKHTWPSG
jgi:hypothetical protein